MSPKVRFLIVARYTWAVVCFLVCVGEAFDLVEMFRHPENYARLWNSVHTTGIWWYESALAYLGHGVILLVWFTLGVGLGMRLRPPSFTSPFVIHAVLTALLWAAQHAYLKSHLA